MDRRAMKGKEEGIRKKADLLQSKMFNDTLALEQRPAGLCVMPAWKPVRFYCGIWGSQDRRTSKLKTGNIVMLSWAQIIMILAEGKRQVDLLSLTIVVY